MQYTIAETAHALRNLATRSLFFTLFVLAFFAASSAAQADEIVILKAYSPVSDYVKAKGNGDAMADGSDNDPRIQFLREDIGGGRFYLKSIYGTYLTADGGGGGGVHADVTVPGDHETFSIDYAPPFSLEGDRIKTFDGSYLCAKLVGGLNAKSSSCSSSNLQNTRYFHIDNPRHPIHFDNVDSRDEISDGEWDIVGDLRIPTPEGDVVIPNANVTVDYGDSLDDGVVSFTGTADMPNLPSGSGCGLWCSGALGYNPTTTATNIQVGYGRPSDMPNPFDLPLNDDVKYLYLLLESGHGVDWNGHSVASPDSGAMQIVIDHQTPTVFFYTDFPYGMGNFTGPLQSIGYGVSRGSHIPFTPLHTAGVASWMTPFDAELYLGGEIDLSLIEGADLILESDVFMDVNNAAFVENGDFLNHLGYNGVMTYGAELGPISLSFYLGSASVRYKRTSTLRRVAVSGVVSPDDDFAGIPFRMKRNATFYGYYDDDPHNSAPNFFHIEGEMDLGTAFAKQKIEGFVEISENGGSFEGTAKFNSTTVSVEGDFSDDRIYFEGSVSHNWNIGAGKIETSVDIEFDSDNNGVELDARIKFCENGFNTCDSVGGSVEVNGSGDIRVCARIPGGVGERCDTI